MRNAIILHGTCDKEEYFDDTYPSLSNSHWFPWLQKQLLINGIPTNTPEVPDAYEPDYPTWEREFERFDVGPSSILIGHSCGGGFLVRWLSENKVSANKLILVAPWLDPSRRKTKDFFDFEVDQSLQDRTDEIHVLHSSDDENEGIKETVSKILKILPKAQLHKFEGMGHFTFGEMGKTEFPELLEIVLK